MNLLYCTVFGICLYCVVVTVLDIIGQNSVHCLDFLETVYLLVHKIKTHWDNMLGTEKKMSNPGEC